MQATGFDAEGFERWRGLVDKALRGAGSETPQSLTDEGIALGPLHAGGDLPALATRPGGTPWTVAQRVDHPDPHAARAQAMAELEGGATGLVLPAQGSAGALGFVHRARIRLNAASATSWSRSHCATMN